MAGRQSHEDVGYHVVDNAGVFVQVKANHLYIVVVHPLMRVLVAFIIVHTRIPGTVPSVMAAAEKPGGVAAAPTIALGPGRISQDLMD